MDNKNTQSASQTPLVYPEPVFGRGLVDAATFLYWETPPVLTLAPAPTIAGGGFEIEAWVHERQPDWAETFLGVNAAWGAESNGCTVMMELLEPLRRHFTSALVVCPAGPEALDRVGELIAQIGISPQEAVSFVNPYVAAGELMNHIYLDMWWELDQDSEALYRYVTEVFSDHKRFSELLTRVYLLRICHLPAGGPFNPLMLNNPSLVPFLLAVPGSDSDAEVAPGFRVGHAAWEIFRQLLRPPLEPLEPRTVELMARCLDERCDEIDALIRQCERLAEQIVLPEEPRALVELVSDFIRLHVADDVAELLQLNATAKQAYLDSLFGDRATWLAALVAAHGATGGGPAWTIGGSLGAISTLASHGYTALTDRRRRLAASDYRLIYTVSR